MGQKEFDAACCHCEERLSRRSNLPSGLEDCLTEFTTSKARNLVFALPGRQHNEYAPSISSAPEQSSTLRA